MTGAARRRPWGRDLAATLRRGLAQEAESARAQAALLQRAACRSLLGAAAFDALAQQARESRAQMLGHLRALERRLNNREVIV